MGTLYVCCSCEEHYGGDSLACGGGTPCACDCHKVKPATAKLDLERYEWLLRCEAAIKSMAAQFICPKTTAEEMVNQILKGEKHA